MLVCLICLCWCAFLVILLCDLLECTCWVLLSCLRSPPYTGQRGFELVYMPQVPPLHPWPPLMEINNVKLQKGKVCKHTHTCTHTQAIPLFLIFVFSKKSYAGTFFCCRSGGFTSTSLWESIHPSNISLEQNWYVPDVVQKCFLSLTVLIHQLRDWEFRQWLSSWQAPRITHFVIMYTLCSATIWSTQAQVTDALDNENWIKKFR